MTAYHFTPTPRISPDVAARKAARKQVIEKAQQLERESYKEILIKAGMSPASAASLINEFRKIDKLEGNPSQVIEGVKTLRDKACDAAVELQTQRQSEMEQREQQFQAQQQKQKAEMERRERHHQIYHILRKVATGAGGVLIVGLNFSTLAATVGLSASGGGSILQ